MTLHPGAKERVAASTSLAAASSEGPPLIGVWFPAVDRLGASSIALDWYGQRAGFRLDSSKPQTHQKTRKRRYAGTDAFLVEGKVRRPSNIPVATVCKPAAWEAAKSRIQGVACDTPRLSHSHRLWTLILPSPPPAPDRLHLLLRPCPPPRRHPPCLPE